LSSVCLRHWADRLGRVGRKYLSLSGHTSGDRWVRGLRGAGVRGRR
jgi:hypothetical protein